MNGQIKELMGKTLDKHFSHTWTVMDYEDVGMFAEKFAELIVQECIAQVEKNFAGTVGTYAGAHNSAVLKCKKSIQDHFSKSNDV